MKRNAAFLALMLCSVSLGPIRGLPVVDLADAKDGKVDAGEIGGLDNVKTEDKEVVNILQVVGKLFGGSAKQGVVRIHIKGGSSTPGVFIISAGQISQGGPSTMNEMEQMGHMRPNMHLMHDWDAHIQDVHVIEDRVSAPKKDYQDKLQAARKALNVTIDKSEYSFDALANRQGWRRGISFFAPSYSFEKKIEEGRRASENEEKAAQAREGQIQVQQNF